MVSQIDIREVPVSEYNITKIDVDETVFYYDADSRLISSVTRSIISLDREDQNFINSLGWQDEYGNGETGEEVYKNKYNVWKESSHIEYVTKDTRDENGRLVLRETTKSGWSDPEFTEEFSYDDTGNIILRIYKTDSSWSSTKEKLSYDNGRLASQSVYLDDACVYQFEYWYDDAGQRYIKEERKSKTIPEPSSVMEFDNRGNLIVEIATTSGVTNRYEYTYDAKDNMTSVTRYQDGAFAEKIEYDTTTPSFKSGGTAEIYGFYKYSSVYQELRQAKYSDSHLFYLFDQPFKVKSYKYFDQGEVREVKLYYSKFIDEETAIENIPEEETSHAEYYDLEGRKLASPVKGINIVKQGGNATMQINK